MADRLEMLLHMAEADENVRAVVLYGSRADDEIEPDEFQDWDVYFIVRDPDRFDMDAFDEAALSFEASRIYPQAFPGQRAKLMLFRDGSRVDLTVCPPDVFLRDCTDGRIMKKLMDKDGVLPELNGSDRNAYWVKPMDGRSFRDTCAEFFWEVQNMVKGLKRDELSYAMFIRDVSLRDMLNRMVDQVIGMRNGYSVSVGTLGKYRKRYLSAEEWAMYERTYIAGTPEERWESLVVMTELFGQMGRKVAGEMGFTYPETDEQFIMEMIG